MQVEAGNALCVGEIIELFGVAAFTARSRFGSELLQRLDRSALAVRAYAHFLLAIDMVGVLETSGSPCQS